MNNLHLDLTGEGGNVCFPSGIEGHLNSNRLPLVDTFREFPGFLLKEFPAFDSQQRVLQNRRVAGALDRDGERKRFPEPNRGLQLTKGEEDLRVINGAVGRRG